jgi:hypothetical protein
MAATYCAGGRAEGNRIKAVPESEALCELWVVQSSDNGRLENGACPGVKNIGKPGQSHQNANAIVVDPQE